MHDPQADKALSALKRTIKGNAEALKALEALKKRLEYIDGLVIAWDDRCAEKADLFLRLGNADKARFEVMQLFEPQRRLALLQRCGIQQQHDASSELRVTEARELGREILQ